jgi:hypothetical protein
MEIVLNTSGFGFSHTMNTSFNSDGVVSTDAIPTPVVSVGRARIQEHLDAIKEVFLSPGYDDSTMGYIVEDHIYAIQEILDADGL